TGADGGTLYLVSGDSLDFRIVQTGTLGVRMGGPSGAPIAWPPVPLKVDGRPNEAHVCAWAAVHGRTANIPDVYEAEGYDFRGTRLPLPLHAGGAHAGPRVGHHAPAGSDSVPEQTERRAPLRRRPPREAERQRLPPGPDGRRFAPADADAGHCRRVRSAHRRR